MSRRAPGRAAEMASAAWTIIASSDGQSMSMWCAAIAITTASLSPCLRRKSMPICRCVPSISRSIALPMSWTNAARTATCASRPTSRAMMPASRATSAECESTFWP